MKFKRPIRILYSCFFLAAAGSILQCENSPSEPATVQSLGFKIKVGDELQFAGYRYLPNFGSFELVSESTTVTATRIGNESLEFSFDIKVSGNVQNYRTVKDSVILIKEVPPVLVSDSAFECHEIVDGKFERDQAGEWTMHTKLQVNRSCSDGETIFSWYQTNLLFPGREIGTESEFSNKIGDDPASNRLWKNTPFTYFNQDLGICTFGEGFSPAGLGSGWGIKLIRLNTDGITLYQNDLPYKFPNLNAFD